jgi:hypothetical protein
LLVSFDRDEAWAGLLPKTPKPKVRSLINRPSSSGGAWQQSNHGSPPSRIGADHECRTKRAALGRILTETETDLTGVSRYADRESVAKEASESADLPFLETLTVEQFAAYR